MEEKRASESASEREEGETDRDMGRARKGNAMLTRANEEHVKEFEGSSEMMMMMMKAAAVVNVVQVSRECPMIAPRCIGLLLLLYLLLLRFLFLALFLFFLALPSLSLSLSFSLYLKSLLMCLHLFISDMSICVDIYYYSIY